MLNACFRVATSQRLYDKACNGPKQNVLILLSINICCLVVVISDLAAEAEQRYAVSLVTLAGSLSRRRPWKCGWRSCPALVHSLNAT